MILTILIINIIALIAIIYLIVLAIDNRKIEKATILGTENILELSMALYSHFNYNNASLKLMLEDIEHRNNNRLQKAIDANDFQQMQYYKSIAESIIQLKTMTNNEIEGYTNEIVNQHNG